jgi:hypothetical protein
MASYISNFNIQLRVLSLERKRRKSKLKKRLRNILNNKPNPYKPEKYTRNRFTNQVEDILIETDIEFTLLETPENVIDVVNSLNKHKTNSRNIRNITIDLSKIVKVDIGAINFLLAKINEFSKIRRIRINGNMPVEEECRRLFIDSGFLDYMTDLSGNRFTKNSESFIISVGSNKTMNERVGKSIERSMKYLLGEEQKYQPVYSIIQEICSNSVEWANPPESKNHNWFLGIFLHTKEDEPHITFAITDIGYGILHTLNRRFGTIIKEEFLDNVTNTEILMRAFERKYGSKTGEPNRNKGMPLIKDRFKKGYICNLKVLTNNVLLDFADVSKSKCINKNLPGTFYSWSVTQKCIDQWKSKTTI